ncbi:MAG: glycosyltransferase family 61 protein [Planctomycetia bacterium]|nr:glycosyltransferase family 61 protein [Planctomycetia bacterium]
MWVAFASTGHFGHELTEFAGNIGSLLACPTGVDGIGGRGALLVVPAKAAHASARLAAILGLPRERVLCTASLERPVRICRAFVPGPSMHNRHGLSLRHFEHVRLVLSRLYGVGAAIESLALPDAGEKLYLTRSLLPEGKRRVRAEEELERELTAAGWRIVAPERLPLAEQLRHLAAARTIAGSLGSALHLVMAFGTSFGHRRLISLGPPAKGCNPNVALQALRQGMPMRHVVCQEPDPESEILLRFTVPPARVATVLEALALLPQW